MNDAKVLENICNDLNNTRDPDYYPASFSESWMTSTYNKIKHKYHDLPKKLFKLIVIILALSFPVFLYIDIIKYRKLKALILESKK